MSLATNTAILVTTMLQLAVAGSIGQILPATPAQEPPKRTVVKATPPPSTPAVDQSPPVKAGHKSASEAPLSDNRGIWVVVGALIGAMSSLLLLLWKDRLDRLNQLRLKKEAVFEGLSDSAYRFARANALMEINSCEQEFYLAMTNANRDPAARELYMFMYKDASEKYAAFASEHLAAFGDLNKLIAQYVIITKDFAIAREFRTEIEDPERELDYAFPSDEIPKLSALRSRYLGEITKSGAEFAELIERLRMRVYQNLGFDLKPETARRNGVLLVGEPPK